MPITRKSTLTAAIARRYKGNARRERELFEVNDQITVLVQELADLEGRLFQDVWDEQYERAEARRDRTVE